ncbi:hypothetical protein [Porphyromonas uenonis]|uniref:hypothetical protein n=1 Tax=Porphyromonas uenonis TaxID=281920 RepID=UPI0026F2D541|nr:hypothetical protein [Porphyromonas uenonis]
MKRLLPLLFLYLLATFGVTAQEKNRGPIFHTGSEGPVYDYTVEAGFPRLYYDDGGPSRGMRGNYSKTIIKLKPLNSNSHITIVFEQMEIGEYDELRFYNGAIELWNGPNEDGEYYYDWPKGVDPIKTVKGTPSNPHFTVTSTAADGCLSVALFNGSNSPGWKAMVYCVKNGDPEPIPEQPAIVMTVEKTDKPIKIATGGLKETKFSIDWGDGNKVEYEGLKAITKTPLGNTIKIYGDDILALQANNIGLTVLDVTNAPKLLKLICNNNKLSELDLTKNTALAALYCSENLISKPLNISECTKMRAFDISRNAIPGKLDLSKMSKLSSFKCFNNAITELLLPKTAPLNTIDCDSNRIATLDLTGINDLAELNCAYNELTELTLTKLPNLSKVYAPGNKLSKITFDPKTIITDLTLFSNKFATIDLSALPKLTSLYLQDNELTSIDLTVTPLIKWLNLGNNKLSSLNVTPLTGLMNLRCGGNQIPSIDLSQAPLLNTILIDDNKLTELDVQHQKNLFWLTCSGNELTKLDLSHNPSIVWLQCSRNKLTQLDLSAQKAVQMLYCDHNQISELKITNYAGLQGLFLQNNMMPATALNSLIKALPNVSKVEVHDNNREWAKQLNISENPGTAEADITPAQSNGWVVTKITSILAPTTAEATSIYYDADQRAIVSETPLAQITLYSLQGEMIMHATSGGTHYALPELPVGSYLVHVESADGAILTLKVVVAK